jgi:hypothetical protein
MSKRFDTMAKDAFLVNASLTTGSLQVAASALGLFIRL